MPIIGVDEVGRGAWAGPLLVCAVRLTHPVSGLADSKAILKKKRERLALEIAQNNAIGYGWVAADELDDIGLSAALSLAAARALYEVYDASCCIITDGAVPFYPLLSNEQTLIKADASVPAVSAASIVAKVARDARMAVYATEYPNYGFEKHVGYGTREHREALRSHGYTPLHRRSFCITL